MRIKTNKLVDAVSMAHAVTITSDAINLESMIGYAIQTIYTGTPAGTIKIQASIDGVTYSDIASTSQVIAAAGSYIWNMQEGIFYRYAKVVFTSAAGSAGALTVWMNVKGL